MRKLGRKWKDKFVLDAYDMAKEGMSDTEIARTLGVSKNTMVTWKKNKTLLRTALNRAKRTAIETEQRTSASDTLRSYIYNRLPANLQKLWRKIDALEDADDGYERIEAILSDKGRKVRQHLFIYAWTSSNFKVSPALRKVNISYQTFKKWCSDPEFSELVTEVEWHKKNFFESRLLTLVNSGDSAATVFANRTFNRDRGYHEKVEIEHKHSGTITHAHIDIDELDLPVNVRRLILQAVRKRKQVESREIQ